MRAQPLERRRVVVLVGAGIGDEVAGNGVPERHISVGEFDREILRHLVGQTGVQRPGKAPLRGIAAVSDTKVWNIIIDEIMNRIARETDTGGAIA